jgi:hypothetical protein
LTTQRRDSQPWNPRTEVVVCQSHREARDHFRRDLENNTGNTQSWRGSQMTLTLMNGTTRRYYSCQDGIERLMGLEIHDYYNLIRHEGLYWEFEEFLRHRVSRTQIWQRGREREERRTRSIADEWRIFLSKPVRRWIVVCQVILVILIIIRLGALP